MFNRTSDYKYSSGHIILMKLNNSVDFEGGVTYIKGNYGSNSRDIFIDFDNLKGGTYVIFAEVEWNASQRSEDAY